METSRNRRISSLPVVHEGREPQELGSNLELRALGRPDIDLETHSIVHGDDLNVSAAAREVFHVRDGEDRRLGEGREDLPHELLFRRRDEEHLTAMRLIDAAIPLDTNGMRRQIALPFDDAIEPRSEWIRPQD